MRAIYDVPAPAKLNLFLHITGRRNDGYHLLQSVFVLIDWCDTLHFESRADGQLTRSDLAAALPADDLVLRAARALQALAGPSQGADIFIDKQIPAQAGMGGGSSDAASCLLALNRLWALNLPIAKLEEIGLALGADVPFFIRGHNALVEGIGEIITPLRLSTRRFAVVKPPEGLETRLIFASPMLERATVPIPADIIFGFAANDAAEVGPGQDLGRNDLQPVAQKLCSPIGDAIQWLGAKGLDARMTGSGSAVFARMSHDVVLEDAPAAWQVRKCESLEVHPLSGWAV